MKTKSFWAFEPDRRKGLAALYLLGFILLALQFRSILF